MRLLIVEDEWLVAQFIADIAQTLHIDIAGLAQSYNEAIELIETDTAIDCAIVDINLKGPQHGIDVARHLREKEIKFLFLTAYKDMDTIQEATNLNPLSYLIKPISEENLIAALMIIKNHCSLQNEPKTHPFTIEKDGMILQEDQMLSLSQYERIVLTLLIKNYRCVVSRETFFEHLWNCPDDINEGTLRNTILKLRKKLNIEIENVRNVGYIFSKYL